LKNFIQNKPKGFQSEHTMVFFWGWDKVGLDLEIISFSSKSFQLLQKIFCNPKKKFSVLLRTAKMLILEFKKIYILQNALNI